MKRFFLNNLIFIDNSNRQLETTNDKMTPIVLAFLYALFYKLTWMTANYLETATGAVATVTKRIWKVINVFAFIGVAAAVGFNFFLVWKTFPTTFVKILCITLQSVIAVVLYTPMLVMICKATTAYKSEISDNHFTWSEKTAVKWFSWMTLTWVPSTTGLFVLLLEVIEFKVNRLVVCILVGMFVANVFTALTRSWVLRTKERLAEKAKTD